MIYILGVNHQLVQFQYRHNDRQKISEFIEKVKNICIDKNIGLIAEEFSNDALEYYGIDNTYVGNIVNELGVEYLLCDPGKDDRRILGIKQRGDIALELGILWLTENQVEIDRINEAAAESDRKREKYWLDQIKIKVKNNKQYKDVLLICGFNHVDYFICMAKKENFNIKKID